MTFTYILIIQKFIYIKINFKKCHVSSLKKMSRVTLKGCHMSVSCGVTCRHLVVPRVTTLLCRVSAFGGVTCQYLVVPRVIILLCCVSSSVWAACSHLFVSCVVIWCCHVLASSCATSHLKTGLLITTSVATSLTISHYISPSLSP